MRVRRTKQGYRIYSKFKDARGLTVLAQELPSSFYKNKLLIALGDGFSGVWNTTILTKPQAKRLAIGLLKYVHGDK